MPVKSNVKILQNFVAFSEYMKFTLHHLGQLIYARKIVLMITIVPIPKYASKKNAK